MGRMEKRGLLATLALAISACSATTLPQQQGIPGLTEHYVACEHKESQICTTDYDPVCAIVDTGRRCIKAPCDGVAQRRTLSNGCAACSTAGVVGYVPGRCEAHNERSE